jgi:hypothetical protein
MIVGGAENATSPQAGTAPELGGIVVCALCRECSGYNTSRRERSSRVPGGERQTDRAEDAAQKTQLARLPTRASVA